MNVLVGRQYFETDLKMQEKVFCEMDKFEGQAFHEMSASTFLPVT